MKDLEKEIIQCIRGAQYIINGYEDDGLAELCAKKVCDMLSKVGTFTAHDLLPENQINEHPDL